jgi:hypothetical protein
MQRPSSVDRRAGRGLVLVAGATIAVGLLEMWPLRDLVRDLYGEAFVPGTEIHTRVQFAQIIVTMIAGIFVVARRPWARLWLVLVSSMQLGIFVAWPPSSEILLRTWAKITVGDPTGFRDAVWVAELAVVILTLLVLARPRPDFPRLGWPGRSLVTAGALLLTAYTVAEYSKGMQLAVEGTDARSEGVELATDGMQLAMGGADAGEVRDVTEPEAGVGIVRLRPTFRGKALEDISADDVSLTLQPYELRRTRAGDGSGRESVLRVYPQSVLPRTVGKRWRLRDDRIEVPAVPAGRYMVTLKIGRDAGPGFRSRTPQIFETAYGEVEKDVPVLADIRLREPRVAAGQGPSLRSPVRLAWEPIPGAEYYEVGLLPKDGGAGPGSDVTEPEWHTEVEPGRWIVQIDAIADHHVIGTLDGEPLFHVGAE